LSDFVEISWLLHNLASCHDDFEKIFSQLEQLALILGRGNDSSWLPPFIVSIADRNLDARAVAVEIAENCSAAKI
jgi:hypothetical protein